MKFSGSLVRAAILASILSAPVACVAATTNGEDAEAESAGALARGEWLAEVVLNEVQPVSTDSDVEFWTLARLENVDHRAATIAIGYAKNGAGKAVPKYEVVNWDGTKEFVFRNPDGQPIEISAKQTKAFAQDWKAMSATLGGGGRFCRAKVTAFLLVGGAALLSVGSFVVCAGSVLVVPGATVGICAVGIPAASFIFMKAMERRERATCE